MEEGLLCQLSDPARLITAGKWPRLGFLSHGKEDNPGTPARRLKVPTDKTLAQDSGEYIGHGDHAVGPAPSSSPVWR